MMKKQQIKLGILVLVMFSSSVVSAQQAYTYTQYMNTLTPYNTAYSVVNDEGSINAVGRKQWVGIKGAPTSFAFSASLPLEVISSTVGLVAMHDQFGIEKLTELNAFYAKSVRLAAENYLAASINAGLRNYNAAFSQLDGFDPKFTADVRENTGTIGLSVMLYNPERYYVGASMPRLSMRSLGKGSVEDERYQRNNWYFSGAYIYELGGDMKVKPATLISYAKSLPTIVDISATLYLKEQLGLGLGYRSTNEISALLSYFFNDNLSLGYSYQAGFGAVKVGSATNATHEISIGFRFGDIDTRTFL